MTSKSDELLRKLFDEARDDTRRALRCADQTADLECSNEDAQLSATGVQGGNGARFFVRITGVLKKLYDDDNLCEKFAVDCCRHAGFVRDDNPRETKIETRQRKAEKGEEEHIEVEIFKYEQH